MRFGDPKVGHECEALLPDTAGHDTHYTAAEGAELIVILIEWNELRALDLPRLARTIATSRMGRPAQRLLTRRGHRGRLHGL